MLNAKLKSPAKINQFLHINGKINKLHELQSLMQFIDLNDEIQISKTKKQYIDVKCNKPIVRTENLVYKAAEIMKNYATDFFNVSIELTKNIPIGAGLGGGSSNAATTMVALNQIWSCGLTTEKLIDIGINLGSDIPFFIQGKSAFVEGVGDQITPFNYDEDWLFLVFPEQFVSTRELFNDPNLVRNTPKINKNKQEIEAATNNFKEILINKYKKIETTYKEIQKIGKPQITGTGSCIFTRNKTKDAALKMRKALDIDDSKIFIVKTLNKSPLFL